MYKIPNFFYLHGKQTYLAYIFFIIFGFILGYFYVHNVEIKEKLVNINDISSQGQLFRKKTAAGIVSPLLLGSENDKAKFHVSFSEEIEEYISDVKKDKDIWDISFYARNISTGVWAGANENQKYSPASLMKVPILIATLKQSEKEKNFLERRVRVSFTEDSNLLENFKPSKFVQNGQTYSVRELLEYMIMYSDNNAAVQLLSYINVQNFIDLNNSLEIDVPNDSTGTFQYMSPIVYSRLFRILYNSTYLNQDNSEYALRLLSKNNFENGLIRGVESGTMVSEKFGERKVFNTYGEHLYNELHDCGIVYIPDNPYVICVMTKGKDVNKLLPIISDISKKVYIKMILR